MKHWMNRGFHGRAAFWGKGHSGFGGWGWQGMGQGDDVEANLARALGISVEQLRAARQKAIADSIQQAVADGELAPKEADRMVAWLKLRDYVDLFTLAADVLDITPEQLQEELDGGKSPWDLLAERKLDPPTAMQKLMAAGKARVQQAVADGVITQAQADEIAKMRHRGPMGGPFRFGPLGFFGRGGCGRGHGFASRWGGPWQSGPQTGQDTPLPPSVI